MNPAPGNQVGPDTKLVMPPASAIDTLETTVDQSPIPITPEAPTQVPIEPGLPGKNPAQAPEVVMAPPPEVQSPVASVPAVPLVGTPNPIQPPPPAQLTEHIRQGAAHNAIFKGNADSISAAEQLANVMERLTTDNE